MTGEGHGDEAALGDQPGRKGFLQSGHRGGAGGLNEDALGFGQQLVRLEDFRVGHLVDPSARLLRGGEGAGAAGGIPDADGGGHGLGILHHVAVDERGGAGRLPPEHPRARSLGQGLDKPLPVGGDVAGVANRQKMKVGRFAQSVENLEGGGFLSFDAHGVDGVDHLHAGQVPHLADEIEGVVEISLDRQELGSVHECLGEFAEGDFPGRDDDRGGDAGAGGVGGRGGGGVAGAGADDHLGALGHGVGDRHGHAPVLERGGGVQSLVFEPEIDLSPQGGGEPGSRQKGRVAFQKGDDARA